MDRSWRWLLFPLLGTGLGLVVSSFWTSYSFEILTVVVVLNAMATISLWQKAARRPEKLGKKFLNNLWRSKPITPKHEPPPPLTADMFVVGVKNPEQFSRDFEDFANVINWALERRVPWRLQELPTSKLLKLAFEGKDYGRRYAVFHNQARVGEIELEPDRHYSTEKPDVTMHIELNWVRLLPFKTIREFLWLTAVTTFEYEDSEYLEMNHKIDLAMMDGLWESQKIPQYSFEEEPSHGQIIVELKGSASDYLEGSRRWQKKQQT